MDNCLSVYDLLLPPFYLALILIIGGFIKKKHIDEQPEYEFFQLGLIVKIIGAIALGLVYVFYYGGGDTINYYNTANAYINLSYFNFDHFLEGWLGNPLEINTRNFFNQETGYPTYFHRDKHSFFVVRLLIPIVFIASKSYFCSAILTAFVCYSGIWKLYQIFHKEFPQLRKELAIAILFIPSCVFWGSGILKDSFTLSAVGWYSYSFYFLIIKRNIKLSYIIYLILSSFVILAIKPYILFALLPGSILWLSNNQISKINNQFIRIMIAPFLIALGLIGAVYTLSKLGDSLGLYQIDSVMERATIVQKDMKAEYYGGKSFDIGEFDASIGGISAKAPEAIFAGLFRPGIWDVRNAVMFVSSLENTYLLLLTLFLIIKLKFFGFFIYIRKNPMLMFAMLFALFFSFSVGLTVANFGSLVRLRIPALPFFVSSIFIIKHFYDEKKKMI
jgi:hypothetical protein